jgi:ComF family protein
MLPTVPRVIAHPSEHVDRLVAGASLAIPPLSKAIWHLKYRNVRDAAVPLSAWLADCSGPLIGADSGILITSVPLHARRLRERGYNQAELLARGLCRTAALAMACSVLTRVRATTSQVRTQGRDERTVNMAGAFRASDAVRGRDVVLIDDVCTTGATLEACAAALKEAGARRVTGLVLAHG